MSDATRPSPPPVSRRALLVGAGTAAAAAPLLAAAPAFADAGRDRSLCLGQGTNFCVQASPDGRTLAIDVLGVLWLVPRSGGAARRLTSDLFDVSQPSWSPDGGRLVFQSYREGVFDLWTVRRDGKQLRRITRGPYDHREPRWSPDGRSIVFSSDVGGSYGIQRYDVADATTATVVDTAEEEYEPSWSPDGSRVVFVVGGTRIDVVDVRTAARETLVEVDAPAVLHQPVLTPDGASVVYHQQSGGRAFLARDGVPLVDDEEVFPFPVSFLDDSRFVYAAGGGIRVHRPGQRPARVGFTLAITTRTPRYDKRRRDVEGRRPRDVKGIGSPVLSPDGRRVAFRALNDVHLLTIGGRSEPLTRDGFWTCDPAWSPDGSQLAYSSDRGGTLDLWVRDLGTGADRQVTDLPDRAALSSAWSPDGRELAFLDQDGALWTADVASGDVRRILPATFEPGRPSWSPDGNVIALAAVKPYSSRFREGLSQIMLVDRRTGRARYVEPVPDRSIQTRGDDGPVWSPDGTMLAFALASVLWVLPVEADGTPRGRARRVTDEVSDAPSWSPDSRRLLYLNNGRLRLTEVRGGRTRTVDHGLRWRNVRGVERTVVHAGRMWDGVADRARSDVDVVVEGQRIVDVLPHRDGRDGRLVDASDAFVMPGLIDVHHHREMQGYAYGDRQGRLWLSYGVTTTRSPGSPAYQMVEERESIQSGVRVGPRYLATGEAVDGPRIYYNFMRPTYDADQLDLELERAAALDYDLMKAYVRLPVAWHKRVVAFAHRRGIVATSHYHYPAVTFGGDQTEHVGATSRFGFSRTVTTQGTAYDDVIDTFVRSQMARTPTLFGSTTLYREDRSLVDDRRTRTLYPSWRLAELAETVQTASGTDQTATRANLRAQVGQCLEMVRRGGVVVTGTDSPIDHAALSTHMNLRAMVEYGFTPVQALRTATSAAGEFLGEPIGRVARGRYADLSVVRGDPLRDVRDAAAVERVLVAGVEHDVDGLLAPFETSAAATRAATTSRVLPAVPEPPENVGLWWHDPEYVREARHACCHG